MTVVYSFLYHTLLTCSARLTCHIEKKQTDWGSKLKQNEEKQCNQLLEDIQHQVHQLSASNHENLDPAVVVKTKDDMMKLKEAHKRVLGVAVRWWLPVLIRCGSPIEAQWQALDEFGRTFAMIHAGDGPESRDGVGASADEKGVDQQEQQIQLMLSSLPTELTKGKEKVKSLIDSRAFEESKAEKSRLREWLAGKIDELLPRLQVIFSRSYSMLPSCLQLLQDMLDGFQDLGD